MTIWIYETEDGGAICEIEHPGYTEFRFGFDFVYVAGAAMAMEFPNIVPTIERLTQPELKLGAA